VHGGERRGDEAGVGEHLGGGAPVLARAGLVLGRLLGDVGVHGAIEAGELAEPPDRHRAHRVGGEPHDRVGCPASQPGDGGEHVVGRVIPEPPLVGPEREAGSRAGIGHPQEREADPHPVGGGEHAERKLVGIGVAGAVRLVVQVVELTHVGDPGLEHLEERQRGHRLDPVRIERVRDRIHPVAPAPEVVGAGRTPLDVTAERALKRVGVSVHQAREHQPRAADRAGLDADHPPFLHDQRALDPLGPDVDPPRPDAVPDPLHATSSPHATRIGARRWRRARPWRTMSEAPAEGPCRTTR
jgi:hypothetical protein